MIKCEHALRCSIIWGFWQRWKLPLQWRQFRSPSSAMLWMVQLLFVSVCQCWRQATLCLTPLTALRCRRLYQSLRWPTPSWLNPIQLPGSMRAEDLGDLHTPREHASVFVVSGHCVFECVCVLFIFPVLSVIVVFAATSSRVSHYYKIEAISNERKGGMNDSTNLLWE